MEKILEFLSEKFQFLVVKFSIYLNRRVFVMKLFANSGDPDQTPLSATSDLGLYCLAVTLLWVS